MLKDWFYGVSAGGKGFIRNRAEERRYKEALYRAAEREFGVVKEYSCREGRVFFVVSCQDAETVKSIVKRVNAGYGKYKRFAGEGICFDKKEPELLKNQQQYSTIKQQFFNSFYIAE